MKKLLLLLMIIACSAPMKNSELVLKNNKMYLPNSEKPYTGEILDLHENGNKAMNGFYKNGVEDGLWILWHENGQKYMESIYNDGVINGQAHIWSDDGRKQSQFNYKDGKKDGLNIGWYWNGNKLFEKTYDNGKLISEKKWDIDGNPLD